MTFTSTCAIVTIKGSSVEQRKLHGAWNNQFICSMITEREREKKILMKFCPAEIFNIFDFDWKYNRFFGLVCKKRLITEDVWVSLRTKNYIR